MVMARDLWYLAMAVNIPMNLDMENTPAYVWGSVFVWFSGNWDYGSMVL